MAVPLNEAQVSNESFPAQQRGKEKHAARRNNAHIGQVNNAHLLCKSVEKIENNNRKKKKKKEKTEEDGRFHTLQINSI